MSQREIVSRGDLSLAPEATTICGNIYILLQRIYDDNDHKVLEAEIIELANALMSGTKTYDILFLYLYDSLMNLDYGKALQVGGLLLQHEAMLHAIASEKFAPDARLN